MAVSLLRDVGRVWKNLLIWLSMSLPLWLMLWCGSVRGYSVSVVEKHLEASCILAAELYSNICLRPGAWVMFEVFHDSAMSRRCAAGM